MVGSFHAGPEVYHDADLGREVLALLDLAWPLLSRRVARASEFQAKWTAISNPFIIREKKRPLAHVGVLEQKVFMGDKVHDIGGIHAVCTHPGYRGRGLCRELMEKALTYCDALYDTVMLFTDIPELYERFGFRLMEESRFILTDFQLEPGKKKFRPLRSTMKDVQTIGGLISKRRAVSQVYGPLNEPSLFILNEILARGDIQRLHYAEELDLLMAFDQVGATLRVYDIVAERIPSLEEIVECLPRRVRRVEIFFTPDQFAPRACPEKFRYGGDCLMVRGPFPPDGKEFIVPPLAHC